MTAHWQLAIDCADPARQAVFWCAALGYVEEPPPEGYADWHSYWREVGVPEEELSEGSDRIVDPEGRGPRIWFQVVPEGKAVKNRLHIDIRASGGRATSLEDRRRAVLRRADELVAVGATLVGVIDYEGLDHFAVAMLDPEGNEFDIN